MTKPAKLLDLAAVTRNDALEFGARTLKNLEFLERARERDEDVHVVTHVANSLLGLIVFTVEKHFVRFILKQSLEDLAKKSWPSWRFELGASDTLGDLVYHLRNALAHGRLVFSADSRNPADVRIQAEDARPNTKEIYWRASISATDLRVFCRLYIALLDDVIG
jgi:hypothetical protein